MFTPRCYRRDCDGRIPEKIGRRRGTVCLGEPPDKDVQGGRVLIALEIEEGEKP